MNVSDAFRRTVLGLLSPGGRRARLMILTFHQVPREPDPIAPGLPSTDVFAAQMRWLADICNVLPLPAAAQRLRDNELPARAACVTFDDGYADNHDVAAPILADLGLTGTFFITGGAIEQGIMWNDLVIEGLRRAQGDLDLTDLGFSRLTLTDAASRRAAINATISALKYQQLAPRWRTAEAIFMRATGDAPPRLMMTREQIAALAAQGHDIGAHTINHPILKELAANDARQEIEASRDWVADVTGTKPVSFAYPNGKPGTDFDASHEAMVREAGFRVAVSMRWACATHRESQYALPRFTPWERDRRGFWARLTRTAVRSYLPGAD